MKKNNLALLWAITILCILIAACGAYLKFVVLKPLGLFQEENMIALPFRLLTDDAMQYMLQSALDPSQPEEILPPVTPEASAGQTQPSNPSTEPMQPSVTPEASVGQTQPSNPSTEPMQPPQTEPSKTEIEDYAALGGVDDSWFDDVLFIGDSRFECMSRAYRLGNADIFYDVGLGAFNAAKRKCSDRNFTDFTLSQILEFRDYRVIYLSFGINDYGYPANSFGSAYREVVQQVRSAQPNAVIVLQGIMMTGEKYTQINPTCSIEQIAAMNQEIEKLANGVDILYLDINADFAIADGYLPKYMALDACHIQDKYYYLYNDWIKYQMLLLGI